MLANLESSAVATELEKVFSFQYQRRAMPKNVRTTVQFCSSHMLVKQYSKFSKPSFNIVWVEDFQMFKLDLEKAEEPEIKLLKSVGSQKKQENSRKTSNLLLFYWLHQSLWLCRSQQTVENSERGGNTRPPDLPLEKPICRSGSNS